MYQAAVFPSFTDSTVVSATPAKSPPHHTDEHEVCIVLKSTMGRLLLLSFKGESACMTIRTKEIKYYCFSSFSLFFFKLNSL